MVKELFKEDKIPQKSVDEEINIENSIAYKSMINPEIRGGIITDDIFPSISNSQSLGTNKKGFNGVYLSDGTDVWKITVDVSGNVNTTKQ